MEHRVPPQGDGRRNERKSGSSQRPSTRTYIIDEKQRVHLLLHEGCVGIDGNNRRLKSLLNGQMDTGCEENCGEEGLG